MVGAAEGPRTDRGDGLGEQRVLVTGAGGLLGRAVLRAFGDRGWSARGFTHSDLDIVDADAVAAATKGFGPRVVVNCAAMTNVDDCETDPARAWSVNAEGAGHVARAAEAVGAEVVHISTDYVFDGERGGYTEDDETNPIQEYGRAKLGGEGMVRDACPRHYVLRSAWIYGAEGRSFVSKIPSLVATQEELPVVADQRSSPTYAPDLAGAITTVVGTGRYGTYHVVNEGSCSYAEFARRVVALSGRPTRVVDVSAADVPRAAPRPADSSLVGAGWRAAGFEQLRSWTEAAAAFWSDQERFRSA